MGAAEHPAVDVDVEANVDEAGSIKTQNRTIPQDHMEDTTTTLVEAAAVGVSTIRKPTQT